MQQGNYLPNTRHLQSCETKCSWSSLELALQLRCCSSHARQPANERIIFHWPLSTALSEFNSQATDELGAPQGLSIHLPFCCFVQQTLNRWAFVLTPSHLLTHPAPNELPPLQWQCAPENWYSHIYVTSVLCLDLCQFYTRYGQSGESTGVFKLITFLWVANIQVFSCNSSATACMYTVMGGPFGNILCSLRFWDFFSRGSLWIILLCGTA